jgi:Asp-tRNA(Asn)/Glu-tRNA(Gln) amidotransferase A subunit family amidase
MAHFPDYEHYDAIGLADLVRRRKVSPAELLEAAIDRVEARNPRVNAVVMKLYDFGRRAIADGLPDGPFTGVPFLLKDLTASLAGVPMTRGSRFFADSPPATADSEHVIRLKRSGLVIFGRTNITGQPAVMLPIGTSAEGLPLAVQLVARHGGEATILRLAAQLEKARPWFDRMPTLAS